MGNILNKYTTYLWCRESVQVYFEPQLSVFDNGASES